MGTAIGLFVLACIPLILLAFFAALFMIGLSGVMQVKEETWRKGFHFLQIIGQGWLKAQKELQALRPKPEPPSPAVNEPLIELTADQMLIGIKADRFKH